MNRSFVPVFAAVFASGTCLSLIAATSAVAAPVSAQLAPFHAISINSFATLHFTQGAKQSVRITATAVTRRNLILTVHEGVLTVNSTTHHGSFWNHDQAVQLTITLPSLTAITDNGVLHGTLNKLNEPALAIRFSGAGSLTLSGQVQHLTTTIGGAARIHAGNLSTDQLTARIGGVGKINVHVVKQADVNIGGVGHVHITGNPPIRHIHTGGVGSVTFN